MKQAFTPDNFIVPLNMNGLKGRMLNLPNIRRKDVEILVVYGQHASLEKWWGLMQYLNRFGSVCSLDLPGFGGMESFYKISQKPTLDNFADYLAAFMKLHYKRKKVVVVGLSFGFVVVTRMLQSYPELSQKVLLLVSLAGFAHSDDFNFNKRHRTSLFVLATILSYRLPAFMFRRLVLNKLILRTYYRYKYFAKLKRNNKERQSYQFEIAAEIWLWQHNDLRTWAATTIQLLRLDNCQRQIKLPVWQVIGDDDRNIIGDHVEQHMRVIFSDAYIAHSKFASLTLSAVADERHASNLIPPELRRVMQQL